MDRKAVLIWMLVAGVFWGFWTWGWYRAGRHEERKEHQGYVDSVVVAINDHWNSRLNHQQKWANQTIRSWESSYDSLRAELHKCQIRGAPIPPFYPDSLWMDVPLRPDDMTR